MTDSPAAPPTRASSFARELGDIAATLLAALLIALTLHTALLQPFTIPSGSMAPRLLTGDYVLVSKWAYGWSRMSGPVPLPGPPGRFGGAPPRRGDVVVFRLPRDPSQVWVKRLIGLPGDRVRVTHGVVRLNGRPLPQALLGPGVDADDPSRPVIRTRETGADGRTRVLQRAPFDGPGDDTGDYVVPAGSVFMMGDNRDNSLDSRWPREEGVGFLPLENILGRVEMVLVSWRPGASLWKPWTWPRLRSDRIALPVGTGG